MSKKTTPLDIALTTWKLELLDLKEFNLTVSEKNIARKQIHLQFIPIVISEIEKETK